MNESNGSRRNLSENSEAEDLFNFDIKKVEFFTRDNNANSGRRRQTFGDLKFFNIAS